MEIVTDERQTVEIENVLSRQKIRKLVGTRRVAIFRRFIRGNTKLIKPKRQIRVCRDPDDDYLLEIATKGKAAFLVSGDNDLLVLDPFRSIRIESYRDFRWLVATK